MFLLIAIQISILIVANYSEKLSRVARTDLDRCKISQIGTEYRGKIYMTVSGVRCQLWHGEAQFHEIDPEIGDDDFPERSMRLAKNYCRNPTMDSRGPWCYTMVPNIIDEECEIPLCNFQECRISGSGAEYGGTQAMSFSGKKCKFWNKQYKTIQGKTEKFSNKNFPDLSKGKAKNFCRNPNDESGGPWCYIEEENYELVEMEYCDIPFCDERDCLVYTRNASQYSIITSMNPIARNMTVWIKLWDPKDENKGQAKLLLSALPIPTSSRIIAEEWRAGCELLISNSGSGRLYPNFEDEVDLEPTPNILLSSNWTELYISWSDGLISVTVHGSAKPIFIEEFGKKNSISDLDENNFFYYGFMGTGVLWSTNECLEFCQVHTTYGMDFLRLWPFQESNTTYDINFHVRATERIALKLYQTPASPYPCFTITIGESKTITVVYQESAKSVSQNLREISIESLLDFWSWNEFTLSIFGPHLRLFIEKHYGNEEILYVKEELFGTLRWFSIGSDNVIAHWTLFCSPGETNSVESPSPPNCLLHSKDYLYKGSQWFTKDSQPCIPWLSKDIPQEEKKDDLFPDGRVMTALNKCRNPSHDDQGPYCYMKQLSSSQLVKKQYCSIRSCRSSECRTAGTANDYIGRLNVTRSGRTCVPWMTNYDFDKFQNKLQSSEQKKSSTEKTTVSVYTPRSTLISKLQKPLNYQRGGNVLSFDDYDYEDSQPTTRGKRNVPSHKYSLVDFKGNPDNKTLDFNKHIAAFFGHKKNINSDRIDEEKSIDVHLNKDQTFNRPVNLVNPDYFNDTLYPEQSAQNASNYCRNPSRNIAGTWCYTTDSDVPQDLCDVRDCDKSDECILLVRGQGSERKFFILPEYRSEGLHFSVKAWEPDNPDSITFTFTADEGFQSKYILKIGVMNNEKVLLYYQGEEGALELVKKKTLPHLLFLGKWSNFLIKIPRGKIEIYYEGATNPLFEWEQRDSSKSFLPIYYQYASELGNTIGVSFDCLSSCQVENTQTERFTIIIPVQSNLQRIQLMIRAEGVVLVPLLLFPATPGYYALTLGEMAQWIYFLRNSYPNIQIFHKQKVSFPSLFTKNTWTNITIVWYNKTLNVFGNDSIIFSYVHTHPLLFYFHSVAVDKGGWATWTANCIPPDIDGDPVDGGWSEWSPWACSASCNGGVGTRKRLCNNPVPNIRGDPCMGPSSMAGRCNMILCGDITEDTVNLIRRRLQKIHTAMIMKEGQSTIIPSDGDIIEIIRKESPDSKINWSHNGIYINDHEERIEIIDEDIVIKRSKVNDSGVYTMTLLRVDGTHMILKLVTLAVLPVRTIVTLRETMAMTLICHCTTLGYLYTDLKIFWTLNNKIWNNYGTSQPLSVNIDYIPFLNVSHHGLWQCQIKQDDLGFNWTTNAFFLKVIGPPNWKTHLMEDEFTSPIFGWMPNESFVIALLLAILIFVTSSIVISTVVYLKFQHRRRSVISPHNPTAYNRITQGQSQ